MSDTPPPWRYEETALIVLPGIEWEEWTTLWKTVSGLHRSISFYVGDVLNAGAAQFGEEFAQVVDQKYINQQRGAMWVCSRIPPSERRVALSYSAHRETAALEPTERRELLDLAEREKWGTREIVMEIRWRKEAVAAAQRQTNGGPALVDDPSPVVRAGAGYTQVPEIVINQREPAVPIIPDLRRRRTAFAEALAAELGLDMTPEFMAAADRVLTRLYLFGYIISEIPRELNAENVE